MTGIYGENSRTKRSIDIPNGYISEQNGMFLVFLLYKAYVTPNDFPSDL